MGEKVALVSDVHANLPALESVMPFIDGSDRVVCTGDLVGYYPFPNQVARRAREDGWICVKGNHEHALVEGASGFNPVAAEALRWTARELNEANEGWLRDLPSERCLKIAGMRFVVTHGAPGDINRYVMPGLTDLEAEGLLARADADVLVLGHTHKPFHRTVEGGHLINPGSVGQPRDGDPRASMASLDISPDDVLVDQVRMDYPIEEVQEEVEDEGLPASLGHRLLRGR